LEEGHRLDKLAWPGRKRMPAGCFSFEQEGIVKVSIDEDGSDDILRWEERYWCSANGFIFVFDAPDDNPFMQRNESPVPYQCSKSIASN
jgi:hypothetical protein